MDNKIGDLGIKLMLKPWDITKEFSGDLNDILEVLTDIKAEAGGIIDRIDDLKISILKKQIQRIEEQK